MTRDGRLGLSWREWRLLFPGFAIEHAAMAKAALALHHATQEQAYLDDAKRFIHALVAHYGNTGSGGYFTPAEDADPLITRPTSLHDEAVPSATSLAADALIRLWHLTGMDTYRAEVDALLERNSGAIGQNLFVAAGLLSALNLRISASQIVIAAAEGKDAAPLLETVRTHWREHFILSIVNDTDRLPPTHPAHGKAAVEGRATAYVCRGEICSLPITTPEALAATLAQ
jgi:uncharacterized protein YyaL (SSP411 family)